jgi:Uma2 family endonuclease
MDVLDKPRAAAAKIPRLQPGDVLTSAEFERRYAAMPDLKKAELIDGIVYMAPPLRAEFHGIPHSRLQSLVQVYAARNPGFLVADNSTLRLDNRNQPQPDVFLMRTPGNAHFDEDGHACGPPELVAEIAASTVSYDLHQKKSTYLRAGVMEYLVWMVEDRRFVWWRLENGEYVEIPPAADGSLESVEFPGLIIDAPALLAGDFAAALARVVR